MSVLTSARRAYKDSTDATTDTLCLRIVRADGTTHRFTDAQSDLVMSNRNDDGSLVAIGGGPVTYQSTFGFSYSATGSTSGRASQVDVLGLLTALGFTSADVEHGVFDRARVYVFVTSYVTPVEDDEKWFAGFFSQTDLGRRTYTMQLKSLLDVADLTSVEVDSVLCRVKLGSVRCGVDFDTSAWQAATGYTTEEYPYPTYTAASSPYSGLVDPADGEPEDTRKQDRVKPSSYTGYQARCTTSGTSDGSEPTWPTSIGATVTDGTVVWTMEPLYRFTVGVTATGGTDRTVVLQTAIPDALDGAYEQGSLKFTTGDNAGAERRILTNDTAAGVTTITVDRPFRYEPEAGDTVQVTIGCKKRFSADCKNRFHNSINFQGKPTLPGRQNVTRREYS